MLLAWVVTGGGWGSSASGPAMRRRICIDRKHSSRLLDADNLAAILDWDDKRIVESLLLEDVDSASDED